MWSLRKQAFRHQRSGFRARKRAGKAGGETQQANDARVACEAGSTPQAGIAGESAHEQGCARDVAATGGADQGGAVVVVWRGGAWAGEDQEVCN
jgi:hypothetical protein